MAIILRLDRMMADRKISLNELSEKVGIANVNLSANYAQTECQFRYCGTAIPFLTVRSTAR